MNAQTILHRPYQLSVNFVAVDQVIRAKKQTKNEMRMRLKGAPKLQVESLQFGYRLAPNWARFKDFVETFSYLSLTLSLPMVASVIRTSK